MDVSAVRQGKNEKQLKELIQTVTQAFNRGGKTTEGTIRLVRATAVLGNGLVAEEVLAVQAATKFLQEAEHVVDAVHHRQAEEVLLPIERG